MINFTLADQVATLRMDDGKANVVGHAFIQQMNEALDRAEKEASAVIIAGRDNMFSGGFDLNEFAKGQDAALRLVQGGFAMLLRLYRHPQPLIAACSGHAIAAGSFMMLCCDTRIAVRGDFKHRLPETALGMNFPAVLGELAAARLSPRFLTAAVIQAKTFNPEEALIAGFVDELVEPAALLQRAQEEAVLLSSLPGDAYARNKLDCRQASLQRMQASLDDMLASSIQ